MAEQQRAVWRPVRQSPQPDSLPESGSGGASSNAKEESPSKRQKKDGEPKEKTKGKHLKGSRQHKGGADKTWTSKDPSIAAILGTMARMSLQNASRNRLALGAVMDVLLVPSEHVLAKEMNIEIRAHSSKAITMREALVANAEAPHMRTLGAPTATLAMTLLETLHSMDVGAVPRENLKTILDSAPTQEQLEEWFAFIKVQSCMDKAVAKIMVSMTTCPHRSAILAALRTAGVDVRHGPAPPGWLEDELAAWLPALDAACKK